MKGIFMVELGGRLLEIDRREVISPIYYRLVREPLKLRAITTDFPMEGVKKERWIARNTPLGENGFSVFTFDGFE